MKKIGILTHFYKSQNFGGCLQAYALCKKLNDLGYNAQQIKFSHQVVPLNKDVNYNFYEDLSLTKKLLYLLNDMLRRDKTQKIFEKWKKKYVPQSKKTYTKGEIKKTVSQYDIFITGSDQVWNMSWYNPVYFLDFVPSDKNKISYAASMCAEELSEYQKEVVKRHLQDFTAVSVREKEMVDMIQNISPVKVESVLDPTLLLSSKEWDEIASPKLLDEKYIYCYFLEEKNNLINLAREYAKKKNLKIVTINNKPKNKDSDFGDINIHNATPSDFISLIKHADCIFTNSFHASVFSGIYQKEVFVFERENEKGMSSRIYTLAKLFGFENRFCDTSEKASVDYIETIDKIDYTKTLDLLNKTKVNSINYLVENIEKE